MTLANVPQVNPNDEVTADSVNAGPNAVAAVVNGNIDDTNVASLSGTKISAGTISAAKMTTDANPETRMSETLSNSIASGCVWSALTGLNGAMTSGVAYVTGKRLTVSAVASKTFTASKDTYVYISDTGSVQYVEVANGAAQPATGSTSALVAKVVTSGVAITAVLALPGRPVTPSQLDISYSTSETSTGYRWIDGKPIYQKTISTGSLNGVTTKSVAHSITGLSYIVKIEAVAASAAPIYYPIPLNSALSGSAIAGVSIDTTNIVFGLSSTSSGLTSSYVTLSYTKA